MAVLFVTYLCCAASFSLLVVLPLMGRDRGRVANMLAGAAFATVLWALASAYAETFPKSLVALVESLRNVAWLMFLSASLDAEAGANAPLAQFARRAALIGGGLAVGIDALWLVLAPAAPILSQPQLLARIGVDVLALSLVENLYRNTPADLRWKVIPTAIALGAMFAYELFFHAYGLLSRPSDPSLTAARALADAIAAPLLILAMVRTKNWRTDIRMSHQAAFHAVTLISSGVFLLTVAGVGMLFRRYGGEWGQILQISSLFGAALVLVTVLSSETARSGIRLAIIRNFFSYRYDYRVEWLRCIEALSGGDAVADLPERVIRTLADIVNSPGGVLFQRRDDAYVPGASWNAHVLPEAREPLESGFMAAFQAGRWIQELGTAGEALPDWGPESDRFWLAVPLPRQGEILAFVALVKPRAPVHPDWEVFDLLRTMARQAAAYLFQQQAERALADAEVLQEYSRRFAFVVHDIKNLSSQLGLILSNARRHGSNPEFQADALHTVENSVTRMNKLLSQLKVTAVSSQPAERPLADAVGLVHEIVAVHPQAQAIDVVAAQGGLPVAMDASPLRSVVSHLINNACEASGPTGRVKVSLGQDEERVTIDISDEGPGMEISFVRNELFRPFRSTKDSGLGIGAYQARELIRGAGGQLDVITGPGRGTTMRIVLPAAGRASSLVPPAA
jgi:putative PEP-CTERM system histidine kinase